MNTTVTRQDVQFVALLKEIGALKDVTDTHIKITKERGGEVMCLCGDGQQFADIYAHRMRKSGKIRPENHLAHIAALNGGPLLLSKQSPLYDRAMEKNILFAVLVNAIPNVALYGHIPCGMAYLEDITLIENIRLVIDGEKTLLMQCKKLAKNPRKYFAKWFEKTTSPENYEGKVEWVKNLFSKVETAMYFHADNGDKRSYFLSISAWDEQQNVIQRKWQELYQRV